MGWLVYAALALSVASGLRSETGYEAWLRYAPPRAAPDALPAVVSTLGSCLILASARSEVIRGLPGMTGRSLRAESGLPRESAVVLGTLDSLHALIGPARVDGDGFLLRSLQVDGRNLLVVTGGSDRGVFDGAFALLRKIAPGDSISDLNETQIPYAKVRWLNHWDNPDGSIERGCACLPHYPLCGYGRDNLRRPHGYP